MEAEVLKDRGSDNGVPPSLPPRMSPGAGAEVLELSWARGGLQGLHPPARGGRYIPITRPTRCLLELQEKRGEGEE